MAKSNSSNSNRINSWKTLPIGKFQKLNELNKEEKNEEFPYKIVGIINGLTLEQVYDMKLDEVHQLIEDTAFLQQAPKVSMPKKSYEINGKNYYVFLNEKDITVSQYVDFQQLAPNVEEHLAQFLSIFFIPEGKTYNNGYNIEFVQQEINNYLSVEDGLSLARFFFRKLKKSIKQTVVFCQTLLILQKMKTPNQEMKKQLQIAQETLQELPTLDIFGFHW